MNNIHLISVPVIGPPVDLWVEDDLYSYVKLLDGGFMEIVRILPYDDVVAVCDDCGLLKNLPINSNLEMLYANGFTDYSNLIVGPVFFVGVKGPDFTSILDDKIKTILDAFKESRYDGAF